MNTNWRYSRRVPNTRDKDERNQTRDAVRSAGLARGSGVKQVQTAGGTAIFVLPQRRTAGVAAAPSWV